MIICNQECEMFLEVEGEIRELESNAYISAFYLVNLGLNASLFFTFYSVSKEQTSLGWKIFCFYLSRRSQVEYLIVALRFRGSYNVCATLVDMGCIQQFIKVASNNCTFFLMFSLTQRTTMINRSHPFSQTLCCYRLGSKVSNLRSFYRWLLISTNTASWSVMQLMQAFQINPKV